MKKISIIVSVMLLGLGIWYLFIKEYDYQMTFRVNTGPASLYYEIKQLKVWGDNSAEVVNIVLVDTASFQYVTQKIERANGNFVLDWNFIPVNDTITKVVVGVISEKHTIGNRLKILTGSSSLINTVTDEMIQFGKEYVRFTKKFRVKINGEGQMPEMEYVYISLKAKRSDKAKEMIRVNNILYPKLIENGLKKQGYPFVYVNDWNTKTDTIQFDFGFPIQQQDSLPQLVGLKYNRSLSKKALKATYYGNYKDSDQAWFRLLEYAKNHNIQIEKTPLEIFYNNPMHGGNELEWKTEVFFPIK